MRILLVTRTRSLDMKYALLTLVALSLVAGSLWFIPASAGCSVQISIPDDPAAVEKLIAAYRKRGPNGLHALLRQYDIAPDPKLIPIIDAVAGQRNAVISRLFWYTDLDQAM